MLKFPYLFLYYNIIKKTNIMKEFKKNCICNDLRKKLAVSVSIEDYHTGPYINLTMEYGTITAHGEDNASANINFCPFCGRKFSF